MTLRELYGGQKLGRPTKYKPEYGQQLLDYFLDTEVLRKIVDDPSGRGGTSTHYEVVRVPSLLGFAAKIGVHRDTLYEWAKATYPEGHRLAGKLKYPSFSDALTRAQAIEKAALTDPDREIINRALYWFAHAGHAPRVLLRRVRRPGPGNCGSCRAAWLSGSMLGVQARQITRGHRTLPGVPR